MRARRQLNRIACLCPHGTTGSYGSPLFVGPDCVRASFFAGPDCVRASFFADPDCVRASFFADPDCVRASFFVACFFEGPDCVRAFFLPVTNVRRHTLLTFP